MLKAFTGVVFSLFTPSRTNGKHCSPARRQITLFVNLMICARAFCHITHCSECMEVTPRNEIALKERREAALLHNMINSQDVSVL